MQVSLQPCARTAAVKPSNHFLTVPRKSEDGSSRLSCEHTGAGMRRELLRGRLSSTVMAFPPAGCSGGPRRLPLRRARRY